jgi:hypothetical protein
MRASAPIKSRVGEFASAGWANKDLAQKSAINRTQQAKRGFIVTIHITSPGEQCHLFRKIKKV